MLERRVLTEDGDREDIKITKIHHILCETLKELKWKKCEKIQARHELLLI